MKQNSQVLTPKEEKKETYTACFSPADFKFFQMIKTEQQSGNEMYNLLELYQDNGIISDVSQLRNVVNST